jgi:voltage-gated potassium channel
MFLLAFGYLLLVAGLLHRATSKSVMHWEVEAMVAGLAGLWPVFVVEALWGAWRRGPSYPRRSAWLRAALVIAMPPWRMALPDPRTGLVWIPRIGWQRPGKELFKRLERAFSGPMLLFAFLILPILALEYVSGEQVREIPALVLALDIGIALVWVAFATEFVFKASVHPKPFAFAKERWLDAAIVLIPTLEFVLTKWVDAAPLARLLRLGRALSPEQIARMQRLYRLQGLATKAWHAFLLMEGVSRLLGFTPEKRLAQVEERIADLEEQLAEARQEADELRAAIAAKGSAKEEPAPQPPPCREGEQEAHGDPGATSESAAPFAPLPSGRGAGGVGPHA